MRIFEEYKISELPRQLLLDEHRTHHCLWALMNKNLQKNPNYTWNGYDKTKLKARHDEVVKEMIKRGYYHNFKSEIDEGCEIKTKN